jgi:rhodanese-related sulfurtransferase
VRLLAGTLALLAVALALAAVDSRLPGRRVQARLLPNQPALRPADAAPAPGPRSLATPAPASDGDDFDPDALPQQITLDQAWRLYELGDPFIDAREVEKFRLGHIAGAFHVFAGAFDINAPALKVLDPSQRVVIYCAGGTCQDSENVAIRLQQAGFTRLHIMTAGYDDWVQAGHPADAGDPEDSP